MTVLANNQDIFIVDCILEGTVAYDDFCRQTTCPTCNCVKFQTISWREPNGITIKSGIFILLLKERKI